MAEKNLGKVAVTTGGTYASSKAYDKLTIVNHNGASWISKTAVPAGNAPSESSSYWQLLLGASVPRIAMTSTSASINPNTFYVWGEVASLDITLNEGASAEENRYMFQFRNPKSGATALTLPDDILWSVDTELGDDGLPLFGKGEYTRIEIIEGLASVKKWALPYIIFADAEVERVLMANGLGDGTGITKQEAKGVTSIGTWFQNNTEVKSFPELILFKSVTALAFNAFNGCSAMQEVGLGDNIVTIGGQAFQNCANLQQDVIVNNCVSIGDKAFVGTGVTKIVAPKLASSGAGASAFKDCESLIFADMRGVKVMKNFTFQGCSALQEIILAEDAESFGTQVFDGCSDLSEIHTQCRKVTTFGNHVFSNCPNLHTELYFDSFIGNFDYATNTSGITLMAFPAAVQLSKIEQFKNCVNLRCVMYGNAVNNIGTARLFDGCTALEAVIILNTEAPTLYSAATLNRPTNCPIYVPDASVELYKGTTNYSGYTAYIKGISDLQTDNPTLYEKIAKYL